jgi:hypothetical protein
MLPSLLNVWIKTIAYKKAKLFIHSSLGESSQAQDKTEKVGTMVIRPELSTDENV